MEDQVREVISQELRRRHGYGMMEGKIKPVQIANAMLREEHQKLGKMADLGHLMAATTAKGTAEERIEAVRTMLERNRERWGRLGEEADLRRSILMTRVLPMLRTLLATDGAAFGTSPEFSSFSSPTALTVTRDISDEHAGAFVHRLWSAGPHGDRLALLDLLRELTSPEKELAKVDDLTAVLVPLTNGTGDYRPQERDAPGDLGTRPISEVERNLRAAAQDLAKYEAAVKPNPMATLQRIVLLASVSLFFHALTRAHDWGARPRRVLLLDASADRSTSVAAASEAGITAAFEDSRTYMAAVLSDLLDRSEPGWSANPEGGLAAVFRASLPAKRQPSTYKPLLDTLEELNDEGADIAAELPRRLVGLLDSSGGRTLDGFLRLLGLRSGLLYPHQKILLKRLRPMDRTLEVLVASTFDLSGQPMEYREFLDVLFRRWGIVTGGRPLEDARLLADAGMPVPSVDLTENSERFLTRMQSLGLARKLADSVAVVGLMENSHADQ